MVFASNEIRVQIFSYSLTISIAILQYVCEAHGKNFPNLYPNNPKERGIVNHRLAFSVGNVYPSVVTYSVSFYLEKKLLARDTHTANFVCP